MAGNLNDSPAYRGRKIRGYKLGGSRPRSSSDICRGGVSIFDLDSRMIRRRGEESNPCEGRESIRDRDMIIEFRIHRFVTSLPYVSTSGIGVSFGIVKEERVCPSPKINCNLSWEEKFSWSCSVWLVIKRKNGKINVTLSNETYVKIFVKIKVLPTIWKMINQYLSLERFKICTLLFSIKYKKRGKDCQN